MQSVFHNFGLLWCVLSCSVVFNSSFSWHIIDFKSTFKKVSLEQRSVILNLDRIRKKALRFITFIKYQFTLEHQAEYQTSLTLIMEKKENTLFQMQASNLHWECFKMIEICIFLSSMRFTARGKCQIFLKWEQWTFRPCIIYHFRGIFRGML